MTKTEVIQIPVTAEIKRKLKALAKEEQLSLAAYSRRALLDGVLWREKLMIEAQEKPVPEVAHANGN